MVVKLAKREEKRIRRFRRFYRFRRSLFTTHSQVCKILFLTNDLSKAPIDGRWALTRTFRLLFKVGDGRLRE